MSSEQTYKFRVAMTCNACLEAVKRSLNKSLGPRLLAVDGDMQEQSVTVRLTGSETEDQVLALVRKAGKETSVF